MDSAVEGTGDANADKGADKGADKAVDAAGRAAEINRRVAGWAYRIPTYKYDSMSKRMADLLQETGQPEA